MFAMLVKKIHIISGIGKKHHIFLIRIRCITEMLAEDEEDMTVASASGMQHVGGSNILEQLLFKLWAILLDKD
jgi:hypothetical protein